MIDQEPTIRQTISYDITTKRIMMTNPFRSLFTRDREFESRVNTELTERSRERLASITNVDGRITKMALSELQDEVGESKIREATSSFKRSELIKEGDTVVVLSYIEHLLRCMEQSATSSVPRAISKNEFNSVMGKISDVLVTEGLLWELTKENGHLIFEPIESEAMEDMDKKVQALAENEPWADALKGYNAAFERYLNGDFDEIIAKKLYNSIEAVLQTICVDLEGWTNNRDHSHSEYLRMLKNNGVYNANGITAPEITDIVDGLEKLVNKVGNDRKQRHEYIDRTYCTLLIHQTGAYLYFLINRYEDYSE